MSVSPNSPLLPTAMLALSEERRPCRQVARGASGREKQVHLCLYGTLETARSNTIRLARPITSHGKDLAANVYDVKDAATAIVQAFRANVPTAPDQWVRIARATPEQVLVALGYLRSMLATWRSGGLTRRVCPTA